MHDTINEIDVKKDADRFAFLADNLVEVRYAKEGYEGFMLCTATSDVDVSQRKNLRDAVDILISNAP